MANKGDNAQIVLSTAQPYDNVMFDVGVMTAAQCNGDGCRQYQTPATFSPLVEGDKFFAYGVETMSSGLANLVAMQSRDVYLAGRPAGTNSHDVLVSLHGRSGNVYRCLRKGGCPEWWPVAQFNYIWPFDEAMRQVADAMALAAASGKSYVVRAATTIHGESNHYYKEGNVYTYDFPLRGTDGTPNKIASYRDALLEWQADLDAGVKAITGQAIDVPLFYSQISGWNDRAYSRIPQDQLQAHVDAPGKAVLVGPAYMIPFAADCLHFTWEGQRRLGEYFAKAYARVVLAGKAWEPLRPREISLAGNVVTVTYHVPSPPLVLDTARVTDPGHHGFELVDDSGATPAITSVALAGPDAVAITLSAAPAPGAAKRLRYAMRQVTGTCPGPTQGARGNLRDSDDTPSRHGYDLHNWGVQFDLPIP